jgi:hypothetical protein
MGMDSATSEGAPLGTKRKLPAPVKDGKENASSASVPRGLGSAPGLGVRGFYLARAAFKVWAQQLKWCLLSGLTNRLHSDFRAGNN